MGETFYSPDLKDLRNKLRNAMTPAEVALWRHLRSRQFEGWKFRRQASIGRYIVDFYCPKAKLVVEVDGVVHLTEEAQMHDKERDVYLRATGLKILRVTNSDVMGNIEGVGEAILDAMNASTNAI